MSIKTTNTIIFDEKSYQGNFYKIIVGDQIGKLKIDKNTDGYVDGAIFEHKENVSSYGRSKALSQALIYLTRFNRDGIPVPKNIVLISQDENKAYIYDSVDYIDVINNIVDYSTLSASKGIDEFKEIKQPQIIEYDLSKVPSCIQLSNLIQNSITNPEYTKVNISEHNVYGWSNYYYQNAKKPKKKEFFDELAKPKEALLKFINPWTGKEKDFALIMDLLNDPTQQKKLGAFYTPPLYAEKALELVRLAISKVPKDNDYIILDRCAGTGSLEIGLTDEELSHVIVNTYELKEWYALKDRLGKLVRAIIPPIPIDKNVYSEYDEKTGFLSGANAMEEDFVNNKTIMNYVDNPNCNVILFENPPYRDSSSSDKGIEEEDGKTKGTFMANEYKKCILELNETKGSNRDISNLFIWSSKYYLKKPEDSYILFSPVKYFKSVGLMRKKFVDGFLFNREHFHASASAISCILWQNVDDEYDSVTLKVFDIVNNQLEYIKEVEIKTVYDTFLKYFDKDIYDTDIDSTIVVGGDGLETNKKCDGNPKFNEDIVAYMRPVGFVVAPLNNYLARQIHYNARGFYIRKNNFVEKLPLFCAKAYPQEKWYERDIYFTTSDGGDKYTEDKEFLKKCLIYSSLTAKNKCRSFDGSDGNHYKNELCFDSDTETQKTLKQFETDGYRLTNEEENLLNEYLLLLSEIKKKDDSGKYVYAEYNEKFSYGLYQINEEINVKTVISIKSDGKEIKKPKYGDLNNRISDYKKKIQKYYNQNITSDLFKYELLK